MRNIEKREELAMEPSRRGQRTRIRGQRDLRAATAGAALIALTLLAGCAQGGGVEATPIPASIVRPEQPTPDFPSTLPPYRLTPSMRTPIFVPTRDPNAANEIAAVQPAGPSQASLLQSLLMNQPPSAMGIAPGGATILDKPNGSALGSVPGAGTVTVTGRSADGGWLSVYTDGAISGWVPVGALVVYGADNLITVERAFSPAPVATLLANAMLPVSTPLDVLVAKVPAQATESAARATAIAAGGSNAFLATTPQPPALATTPGAATDPAVLDAIQVGTVNTTGNLNLRATPTADGAIVAKLPAQSQLIVLGRTSQSDWLRVRAPGGDGWVDARFVDLVGAVAALPVAQP